MWPKGLVHPRKGKKFPHTPEWEAKRLKATREANAKRVYRKGYARPEVSGSLAPNWRGGVSVVHKGERVTAKYRHWRQAVLDRDGHKCKSCGSTEHLEVHHIIPFSEVAETRYLRMNGVTLCASCHHKEFKTVKQQSSIGTLRALIVTIPEKWHEYPTMGNWNWTDDGVLVVFISDLGDERKEFIVAVHEMVEAMLARHHGIKVEDIDAFDKAHLDSPQPGDEPDAPYRAEHEFATDIERLIGRALGVDPQSY